ncbi:SDR family oxidoreductase [Persicitalea jodogahamensis]|uniref:Glucose-1-dehydrogenase n=1 Tax=Persicitalea jodogahamensis TaxID=402147 RepID=A0A8J3GAQ5_9BACT|nr:SDR family oxidoreductase [Persicitalea jodogahamensis]GHB81603.1 glucose-1-dehydrogenase [Persicitalea jodogahamensis]
MIDSSLKFKGQTVIVTGSSSGIGQACAIYFGGLGANVVVNYHSNKEEANETLKQIKNGGGDGIIVKADVSKEEDVLSMFEQTIKKFGRLDVMVSNAGLQVDSPFLEMTTKQWQKVIDVNLTGQFICIREAAKQFVKQAPDEYKGKAINTSRAIGKIVMMSSVHDVIPWAGHVNYAASKGGVSMMMKSVSQELAPYKIRVNSISPGAIQTAINKAVWSKQESLKELMNLIPYRRIGTAEDVAKAVAWLASDESDYVNGETLYIDGGMTLYPEFADNG